MLFSSDAADTNCNADKKIELLAPAKNADFGKTAINFGADAVYIGAPKFGARHLAANSLPDIENLIRYAHRFNAKVYLAVNTLLYDDEIPEAAGIIESLYRSGCDGVIVQDFGLLEYGLPPVKLIASTQVFANTPEKILFLEKIGFKRVVLPRETSLDQIKEIRSNVSLELESFIHGALCVSYSGRCYLSHAIGKRSGNRGECAQPCRKKYSFSDARGRIIAKDSYLLSLKDLNYTPHIASLIEAGIGSFKIEGRLKDEAYVKTVTAHYRREIDAVLAGKKISKASSGKVIFDFTAAINKSYNRGFTDYFIKQRQKTITSFETPKHTGEFAGTVLSADGRSFALSDDAPVFSPGDGITFFHDNELTGTSINTVENHTLYPQNMEHIKKGTRIFRNYDKQYDMLVQKSRTHRKIEAEMMLYAHEKNLILRMTDEDGIAVEAHLENTFTAADNQEKALERLTENLGKLGNTDYLAAAVTVRLDAAPHIPVSVVNGLRREAIEKLDAARMERFHESMVNERKRVSKKVCIDDLARFPYTTVHYDENIINAYAMRFYKKHGVTVLEMGAESGIAMNGKVVMTTKHCLRYSHGLCVKGNDAAEELYLTDEKGKKYTLVFDCQNCVMKIIF